VNLESNVFDGDFAWGIVITCHSVSKHANKMVLNCRNNTFINNTVTNSIVYPTGAYFQTEDFLETQTFRIVNNSIDYVAGTPGNPGTPIYYSSIHPYRGNLQLSDNSGWSKGLVYQEATLRRILPGSNFYFVGTGTSPVAEFGDEMDSCPFGTRGFQVTRSARHATLASATSKVNVYIPDYATASSSWIFSAPYP
jgi:hypothetical protein